MDNEGGSAGASSSGGAVRGHLEQGSREQGYTGRCHPGDHTCSYIVETNKESSKTSSPVKLACHDYCRSTMVVHVP